MYLCQRLFQTKSNLRCLKWPLTRRCSRKRIWLWRLFGLELPRMTLCRKIPPKLAANTHKHYFLCDKKKKRGPRMRTSSSSTVASPSSSSVSLSKSNGSFTATNLEFSTVIKPYRRSSASNRRTARPTNGSVRYYDMQQRTEWVHTCSTSMIFNSKNIRGETWKYPRDVIKDIVHCRGNVRHNGQSICTIW